MTLASKFKVMTLALKVKVTRNKTGLTASIANSIFMFDRGCSY